ILRSNNGPVELRPISGLFLMSFSALTFEIEVTRIASVVFNYHYAFAVISLAVFGLGIGAGMLRSRLRRSPHTAVSQAAVLVPVLMAAFATWPVLAGAISAPVIPVSLAVLLFLASSLPPFVGIGIATAGIFQAAPSRSSWLYGGDLLGATAGALLTTPLLNTVPAPNAILVSALVAAGAAVVLSLDKPDMRRKAVWSSAIAGIAVGVLVVAHATLPVPVANDPDKDISNLLNEPGAKAQIVETRWSAFGRTDLVKTAALRDQMIIYTDGAAGSAMYDLPELLAHPADTLELLGRFGAFFPLIVAPPDKKQSALVIGPGGGRDVVVALLSNVRQVTAVEVNPDVVKIVREHKDFSGGIYSNHPNVKVVIDEGRNYIRSTRERYNFIMLSIPITKSSRSIEGFALTENYLFTVDAVGEYLAHLRPGDSLVVVAHSLAEVHRVASLAIQSFALRGISQRKAMTRMYSVGSGMMPTLVISNEPLSAERAKTLHESMHQYGFDSTEFYIPFVEQMTLKKPVIDHGAAALTMLDPYFVQLANGTITVAGLGNSQSAHVSYATDDSPFFYKFSSGLPAPLGFFALLIVAAIIFVGAILIFPGRFPGNRSKKSITAELHRSPQLRLLLLLSILVGAAYMMVEVSLFQKMTLFIGRPERTLTILLVSLLLGTGLGSVWGAHPRRSSAAYAAAMSAFVALLSVVFGLVPDLLFRIGLPPQAAAMLMLVPLGFLMGQLFPYLLKVCGTSGLSKYVYLVWTGNGVASVLGSAAVMILGVTAGFSYSLGLAAVLYIGMSVGILALNRLSPRNRTPGELKTQSRALARVSRTDGLRHD
ncbi:MAG TPA: hypothetical protein VMW87_05895, partial [Spirochaetia bacterium]|nr:hypothetical protein [Spirochaetia bacterium]